MSGALPGERTSDRSIAVAWVVLGVLVALLAALFGWTFVHVLRQPPSPPASLVVVPRTADPVDGIDVAVGNALSVVSRDGEAAGASPAASPGIGPSEPVPAVTANVEPIDTGGEGAADTGREIDANAAEGAAGARDVPERSAASIRPAADEDLEALRGLLAEASAVEAAIAADSSDEGPAGGDEPPPLTAAVLADLSEAVRFTDRGTAFREGASSALDELAALLAERPDVTVTVTVTGGERDETTRDRVLARERGRTIIAALVDRGVAFRRLSVDVREEVSPATGSHRVRIVADAREHRGP